MVPRFAIILVDFFQFYGVGLRQGFLRLLLRTLTRVVMTRVGGLRVNGLIRVIRRRLNAFVFRSAYQGVRYLRLEGSVQLRRRFCGLVLFFQIRSTGVDRFQRAHLERGQARCFGVDFGTMIFRTSVRGRFFRVQGVKHRGVLCSFHEGATASGLR